MDLYDPFGIAGYVKKVRSQNFPVAELAGLSE
jgi:hypothetical protein